MNTIGHIKIFNTVLDQFLNYLKESFPYIRPDVLLAQSTVSMIRMGNPRLVVESFMNYASPYNEQIYRCDEDFFMDYKNNLIETDLTSDSLLFGEKLKKVWLSPDTTEVHKAHVWAYFHKLLKAGHRCA
jgi:hypothetical protein